MSTLTPGATAEIPLGWYPDPAGSAKLRLWCGDSWTSHLETRGPLTNPEYHFLTDGTIVSRQEY